MEVNQIIKPWGFEYEIPTGWDTLGLWHLIIRPGESTSLHCHPNKKTGLVVLDGQAKVSFLTDSVLLGKLDKRIIRTGVFHSTTNVGDTDLHLLEVETPNNKTDLLRLEDNYGRFGKSYETESYAGEALINIDGGDSEFNEVAIRQVQLRHRNDFPILLGCKIIILDGRLYRGDVDVAGCGDILEYSSFCLLADKFCIELPMEVITLSNV